MQSAKDSFYMQLRNRLAAENPQRTATVDGATRPAIIVAENQRSELSGMLPETFYLSWGSATPVDASSSTLMAMGCTISYCTAGTVDTNGVDRGRSLSGLDTDLLAITSPPSAPKSDYSSGTAVALNSNIFWTLPVFGAIEATAAYLRRSVTMTVLFFPEVNQS